MCNKLMIIGAGGHGKVVANIAKLNGYKEIYFLDDDILKKYIGKYQIIGTTKDIDKYKEEYDFFVAIGNNDIRKNISLKLSNLNVRQPILVHPTAVIDETVQLSEGTVVMANAVINADTKISKGVIINTGATVDHDCTIDQFTHVCPGVHIAGTVNIGKNVWIGIGCTIINNVSVCDNCLIGAGSVVVKNIVYQGIYIGIPCKLFSKN